MPLSAGTRLGTSHVWAAAAAVAVSIGVTECAPWREPERPLKHLSVDLGDDVTLPSTTSQNNVAISPDETRLVYAASVAGGPTRLYVRRQDTGEVIGLLGSDSAHAAAFSPDSKSVVFLAGNSVFRVSSDGGAAQRLAATDSNTQVTWGDNDTIVVSGWFGLRRIPAAGGAMTKLTETDTTISHIHPQAHVLPGGKTVLFQSGRGGSDVTSIESVSVSGGDRKIVLINAGAPHYLPTGHLLYLRQGTLFAQRFDPRTLLTTGDAVPMVTDVRTTMQGLVAAGTFSVGNRTLVYRRATPIVSFESAKAPPPDHTVMLVQNFADEVRRRVK